MIYLLPLQKDDVPDESAGAAEENLEILRSGKISTLTEGTRVFVGGCLKYINGLWSFASAKENPLVVIFFNGSDHSLASRVIRAGRPVGEFWNAVTPYSFAVGALCQILIAFSFMNRPAFRQTVIVSLLALFIPLYPIIPPGLLFTVIFRRLSWKSRILRACRDLVLLPMYGFILRKNKAGPYEKTYDGCRQSCVLPGGEPYGFVQSVELPPSDDNSENIPLLLPEYSELKSGESWHVFGALYSGQNLPSRPEDPLAIYGILPGSPGKLARSFSVKSYVMEITAIVALLAGLGLNIFFLWIVLALL